MTCARFGHRSRLQAIRLRPRRWAGKPVIGILNTWSGINACHAHFARTRRGRERGVWQAAVFPIELPAVARRAVCQTVNDALSKFLAMEREELLRSHPIDGAVLMGGCDKTTPGAAHGRDLDGLRR